MLAAFHGHPECVAALIAAGADCEAKDMVRCCRLPPLTAQNRHGSVAWQPQTRTRPGSAGVV